MENQNYQEKLNIAKEMLKTEAIYLGYHQDKFSRIESEYIGEKKTEEKALWTKIVAEQAIKVEALEHLIWELENFLKQDNSISLEEEKVNKIQADILNE